MPAGLEVHNDSNVLTIDSTFQNISIVSSGSVFCNVIDRNTYTGLVVVSGKNPILGFISSIGVSCILVGRSGASHTYRVYLDSEAAATVNYWVFDTPDAGSGSNFGLQVFNGAGELCFDAARRYLRVLGFFNQQALPGEGVDVTFAGKTIMSLPLTLGYWYTATPLPDNPSFYQHVLYLSFTRVTSISRLEVYVGAKALTGDNSGVSYLQRSPCIAADVTNYAL